MTEPAQEPSASAAGRELVLRVVMQPGEVINGDVSVADGDEPLSFHGWIGLMIAINRLRAKP